MSILKKVDNTDILTKNVDAIASFYHETLGFPFFLPYTKGDSWASIELGNVTLYIFHTDVGEHAPRRTHVNADNAPGLDSFAFEVDDIEAAIDFLDGKVEWGSEAVIPWEHPSGVSYRFRPFYDPDGNMLYITEPHTESALVAKGA